MNAEFDSLQKCVSEIGRVAIALSGGLDSSVLLAFCAKTLGASNCIALTAKSAYMLSSEKDFSKSLAMKSGVELVGLDFEIDETLRDNPPDRCYLCKRKIFSRLVEEAAARNFGVLCDGTNADDLSDYRPGMKALKELGVRSPFLECAMGKDAIRKLAREFGIEQKPPSACLLTRLEHGARVDESVLKKIDEAENYIRSKGFEHVRVRLHGECARIEIDKSLVDEFYQKKSYIDISAKLKEYGFKYVSLDLCGYKTGAMNKK